VTGIELSRKSVSDLKIKCIKTLIYVCPTRDASFVCVFDKNVIMLHVGL